MKLDPGPITKKSSPPPAKKFSPKPPKSPSSAKPTASSSSSAPTNHASNNASSNDDNASKPASNRSQPKRITVASAHDARQRFRAETNIALVRAKIDDRYASNNDFNPAQETTPEPEVEPTYGTGTGTVVNNTNVRSDPSLDNEAQDQISGEVTITGQTTSPDENNQVWYQVEYDVDGETRTGWVRDDVVNDEQIDWREGDPIQLFDANGEQLSQTDTQNYVTAASAQQEMLEEYGVDVQMLTEPPTGEESPQFRPLTPDDAAIMAQTLEQVEALESEDGYNIDLVNAGTEGNTIAWAPGEIDSIHSAVSSAGQAAYDRALEQGYDVESPEQVFRDLYSPSNNPLTVERVNSSRIGSEGYYAFISGSTISLSHRAFYNSGEAVHVDIPVDNDAAGPDFTPAQLMAH
ncbi:MAG: SH3 domain-containing protein, partial [Myxococcota bacterium]